MLLLLLLPACPDVPELPPARDKSDKRPSQSIRPCCVWQEPIHQVKTSSVHLLRQRENPYLEIQRDFGGVDVGQFCVGTFVRLICGPEHGAAAGLRRQADRRQSGGDQPTTNFVIVQTQIIVVVVVMTEGNTTTLKTVQLIRQLIKQRRIHGGEGRRTCRIACDQHPPNFDCTSLLVCVLKDHLRKICLLSFPESPVISEKTTFPLPSVAKD